MEKTDKILDSQVGVDIAASVSKYIEQHGITLVEDLYDDLIAEVEEAMLDVVLTRARGNQSTASQALGISRNTLRKKLLRCGLAR